MHVCTLQGLSDYELYQKYPDVVEKLQSLDSEIIGGTSAIVSLIHKGKLYVASVGKYLKSVWVVCVCSNCYSK